MAHREYRGGRFSRQNKAKIQPQLDNGHSAYDNVPWRQSSSQIEATVQPQTNTQQVREWTSYKNDKEDPLLPSDADLTLSPHAAPFVPLTTATTKRHFKPYQPLRISNGLVERETIERANARVTNVVSAQVPVASGTLQHSRNLPRSARVTRFDHSPDSPLPSIEAHRPLLKDVDSQKAPPWRRNIGSKSRSATVTPPPQPAATTRYLEQAQKPCIKADRPRKLLVILDLNGTLLYRPSKSDRTKVKVRPGATTFLDYLFENHVVMVYTSARLENAQAMVNNFMHPQYRNQLAAFWGREQLGLSEAQYHGKVQVYKELEPIWKDEKIQRTALQGERWDQTNTVLIDDSKLKATAQPHNLVQVPEYTKADNPGGSVAPRTNAAKSAKASGFEIKMAEVQAKITRTQMGILKQLEMKLEELKYQEDVSRLIRLWQTGEVEVPIAPGQEVSVDETVDQKALQRSEAVEDETEKHSAKAVTTSKYGDKAARERGNENIMASSTKDSIEVEPKPSSTQASKPDPLNEDSSVQQVAVDRDRDRSVSSIGSDIFKELLAGQNGR